MIIDSNARKNNLDDFNIPRYKLGFRFLSRFILKISSDFHASGIENLIEPPYILAINHIEHPDAFCVASTIPHEIIALGAKKIQNTLIGRLFSFGAPIWIEQDSSDRQALKQALKVLNLGSPLALSPEGHRSKKPGLLKAKDGVAFLAIRSNTPVIPASIYGTENILKKPRPRVRMIIGKPLNLSDLGYKKELSYYTECIMCAIASMLPEKYHGFYAGNPMIDEMRQLVL